MSDLEAALYEATKLSRARIRAKQAEASKRRSDEFIARDRERHRRAAKTGQSYDEVLAADVRAGDKRFLAWAARRRRQTRRFQAQSAMVARERSCPPVCRSTTRPRSREHRPATRRRGAVGSRDRPRKSDDDEPARALARPPLTRAERAYLKSAVDARRREILAARPEVTPEAFRLFDEDRRS
jgi:hypothetical protein